VLTTNRLNLNEMNTVLEFSKTFYTANESFSETYMVKIVKIVNEKDNANNSCFSEW
jgi:hypothetical protein